MPDFCFGAFLATLDAGPAGNLFRVAGRRFLNVPAFVFSDLRESASSQNRHRRTLSNFFRRRVIVAMLDQQPLAIASAPRDSLRAPIRMLQHRQRIVQLALDSPDEDDEQLELDLRGQRRAKAALGSSE